MRVRRLQASLAAALTLVLLLSAEGVVLAAEQATPMIVVLDKDADVDAAVERGKREHRLKPSNTFRHAARGYAASLTRGQARAIERQPGVMAVIPDSVVELTAQSTPAGIRRVNATKSPLTHIDGVDLASHRANVDVAIIDTGIQPNHPDLRVVGGYDCTRPGTTQERSWSSRWRDDHGHGTHVAGIVGALDNGSGVVGVAPGARLWSVRVFDATGYSRISWITCGIDWVTSKRDPADGSRPLIEVANMSLRDKGGDDGNCGYTVADIEHQAICRSTARGTTYVAAAGNDRNSAAGWRPASYNEVITVSAMADYDGKAGGLASATCTSFGRRDVDDTFADFSNYGGDVDLTAPGVCVRSTIRGSSYGTTSGTSMASPHVAGAAALYHVAHPGATAVEVRAALRAAGAFDWRTSTDRDSVIDPLLDVSSIGAGPGLRVTSATTGVRIWAGTAGATVRFRLTRLDGQSGTATLLAEGLPNGVTATFSRSAFNGRDFGEATVTLRAAAGSRPSDSTIGIVAESGEMRGRHPVHLVVAVDETAPVVGVPAETLTVPSTVSSTRVSVTTRWSVTEAGSGVASSTIGRRTDGGSWTSVATTGGTVRTRAATLPFLTDFQHRIRSTDAAGNVGPFSEGPTFRLRNVSEGTSAATWSSGWSTATTTSALGGRMRYATKAGASVTFRFTGRAVGWVSVRATTRGNARVSIDGTTVGTVYLYGSTAYRRLVFARHPTPGTHTLKITVLGTSGRPRVDVDGFIVME
jgi:subtilisin family serine protease